MTFVRPRGLPDVDAKNPIVLTLPGQVAREAVPGLCAELESRLAGPRGTASEPAVPVECDVGGVAQADLALVEAVARLALVARRAGRQLRLRGAGPELRGLLELVGLTDAVAPEEPVTARPSPPEAGRAARTAGTSAPRPGSSASPRSPRPGRR
ncbi:MULTISPECIES: STAS domain-containing protein [unclassified Streptomyces]|uniref:STAS domain-containing protein n=1 Tax=unclassified Streptomyces TaxID=2593676 RepID=UPI00344FCBE5